jgi:threonine/homoserine/homoserine lactone efflux protein
MRAALPFILVGLALFSAACIAYIAWDLTSEKEPPDDQDD